MHPCLSVDEILRLIFRCVEVRPTLCALARTCRTFNEPATDLIWETLTAVEPILQHLPSARFVAKEGSVTDSVQYLVLSDLLSENDWNTIRRLSSRVRRFYTSFVDVGPDYVHNDVPLWFGSLASPPDPGFLFPNLRDLSFQVSGDLELSSVWNHHTETFQAVIRFFHLLLGPHLSSLRFDIPAAFYAYLDIPSIPALCPNIRMLSIGGPTFNYHGCSIPDQTVSAFSKVVSELCHLDLVRSYMTSWELLTSLAQAKALRWLWMFLPRGIGRGPEHPSGNIFPQLRALDVMAESLVSCVDLFRWTSPNKVTEICICCQTCEDDGDPSQTLVSMSSLISSRCKHLEFLWILSISGAVREPLSAWPRPMLEPYQACHHLRVIALRTHCSLALADTDLEDMVKAWPHLEVFHLSHNVIMGPSRRPVHLSLRGVTALLHRCPKLKCFTLEFDATRVPERATRLSYGTPVRNTAVRRMGVFASPVSASSNVTAYLSTIMPSLALIIVEIGAGYAPEWVQICTHHPRKPSICASIPVIELNSLRAAGTEGRGRMYGEEWLGGGDVRYCRITCG